MNTFVKTLSQYKETKGVSMSCASAIPIQILIVNCEIVVMATWWPSHRIKLLTMDDRKAWRMEHNTA